jgi:hypothetical protein
LARSTVTILVCLFVAAACTDGPLLDRDAVLQRQTWWDNRDWDWYKASIPFFESPNPEIDATYYYRWEVVTKHLTYGSPATGYTFTEFIDRPFWSGAFGAISCPLGHQFYEVRWLKNRRIIEDFGRYWYETPGTEPRSYSNWYGDAMWATYLVLGDRRLLETVLPHMERQYDGWIDEHWDAEHRMFRWDGMHDGMETNINSRLTADTFAGAEGYRPTLNSYLFADARAIARAARLLGDEAKAELFDARAAELKQRVQEELWDPEREFFFHQFANDEINGIRAKTLTYETGRYAGNPYGRELIGYVPWQFNLPDPGYESAWRFLMDSTRFFAPFGPTTVERNDPQFFVSPRCCIWSGNEWPYATTQTLVAFANLLNNYNQSVVTKSDYYRLLETYTLDQRIDGRPYIAEAANPFTGSWEGHNTYYHSEHYFHSGYVDLIITGLAGLRPRADDSVEVNPLAPDEWDYFALDGVAYHGHDLSIAWDRNGTRYGLGSGLSLLLNGQVIANAPTLQRVVASIPPPVEHDSGDSPLNFAVNNGGSAYPWVTASFSEPATAPHYAADGNYWYHESPPNRWTATGSGNAVDWLAIDFGAPRPLTQVKAYFYEDGASVRAPQSYEVEQWDGSAWQPVPGQIRAPVDPVGRRANVVTFPELLTEKVRLVMTHQPNASSGLSELEAWGDAELPLEPGNRPSPNVAFGANVRATASYTWQSDSVEHLNDMQIAFTRYSHNRWTAYQSPNASDRIELDLGGSKNVATIDLYLYADGRGIAPPKSFAIELWDGSQWIAAQERDRNPETPQGSARNRVSIVPTDAERVRVTFEHAAGAFTGVTEIMILEDEP